MDTLLLTTDTWNLCLDSSGNIALATSPYALAQDSASAIKLFQGEAYYATDIGVPYFSEILGHYPPLQLMKQLFVDAALSVPETVSAQCFITDFSARKISGQVQVTDTLGNTTAIGF